MATVSLEEVAEFVNGVGFKQSDWSDEGLRIIRIQNLTDASKPFNRTTRSVKESVRVRPGDLLVSWSATLGVFEWSDPEDALLNQHIFRVIPNGSMVDKQYLRHVLEASIAEMERHVHGATMKHINRKEFLGTKVPLPVIEEQRRIAALLDAADALRAKRRQAIAKLDTLTQAIFIDMFGDPVANDRGWPVCRLGGICTRIRIGPFGSLLHKSDYVDGGIPLVNPTHIVDGEIVPNAEQTIGPEKYAELRSYRLEEGDVVMGRRGAMGRVAIVNALSAGYVCGSGSLYLRPDTTRVIPRYIAAALSSNRGRQQLEQSAQGVTMPNLNSDIVEKFTLGVPPIEVQLRFTDAMECRDRVVACQRAHLTGLQDAFISFQHRAFRGEL